jgi:hypothetical protein
MGIQSVGLGNSASPLSLAHEGRMYCASLIDQNMKEAYAKALYRQALEAEYLTKDFRSPEKYEERLNALAVQYAKGHFALESEFGREALGKEQGVLLLSSLVFGITVMETIQLFAARSADVVPLIRQVIRESLPTHDLIETKKESTVPNAPMPPALHSSPAA